MSGHAKKMILVKRRGREGPREAVQRLSLVLHNLIERKEGVATRRVKAS